jgi:hypothetical protein
VTTVASYGGGVNSTAMLIGMWERGEPVNLILFADTGGEKPETYSYVERFSRWLQAHAMPPITTVFKTTKRQGRYNAPGVRLTLEQHSLQTETLPSAAFAMKSCSMKFKREPQDEFVNNWIPAWAAWLTGRSVIKLIGFDAGEPHRATKTGDSGYRFRYPLIEWGWDRDECNEAIIRAGLCVPPKSSCFFCPHMDELEVLELRDQHPDLLERALQIERTALPHLYSDWPKGLGKDFSWQQIIDYDRDQMTFIPRVRRTTPCECYDGGEQTHMSKPEHLGRDPGDTNCGE